MRQHDDSFDRDGSAVRRRRRDLWTDRATVSRRMLRGRRLHRYTYADYVALERESSTKHEFLDGEIYAMAGRSEEHSALAAQRAPRARQCRRRPPLPRSYFRSENLRRSRRARDVPRRLGDL